MEYLVYRSTALVPPQGPETRAILSASHRNNARLNITGFLHRDGNTFVQFLEGDAAAIGKIFRRIAADTRHCDIDVMAAGPSDRRHFDGWSMGYGDAGVLSFVDFLEEARGTTDMSRATGRDALIFLRGLCQRIELGLAS